MNTLSLAYDPDRDVLTIEGREYEADMFRMLSPEKQYFFERGGLMLPMMPCAEA